MRLLSLVRHILAFGRYNVPLIVLALFGTLALNWAGLPSYAEVSQVEMGKAFEDIDVFVREWKESSAQVKGIVLAVHGTTQHSGSFNKLARLLCAQGFTFVGMDLRGHGRLYHGSEASLSRRRIDYRRSADDLLLMCKHLKESYPGVPVFCLGESVGAAVVVTAASRSSNLMDGIILCSPGTRPCFYNPLLVVPDFFAGVVRLHKLMDVTRYILRYSSDDLRVSTEMVNDPLSRRTLTPIEILRTSAFLRTSQNAIKGIRENLPFLVIQGERDSIVSTASVRRLFRQIGSRDKTLVVLPRCGHVLLGTSYLKPPVIASLTRWLNTKSEEAQSRTMVTVSRHPLTHDAATKAN